MVQLKEPKRTLTWQRDLFQYLMVQLKDALPRVHLAVPVFQYLMVQLKEGGRLTHGSLFSFQYLMVQLKDPGCKAVRLFAIISIPHGTIKSPHIYVRVHNNNISIPHGTIKSFPDVLYPLCLGNFNTSWYN